MFNSIKKLFVWIKNRDETENHNLYDSTRGTTLKLYPDVVDPENNSSHGNFLSAFGSDDGISLRNREAAVQPSARGVRVP